MGKCTAVGAGLRVRDQGWERVKGWNAGGKTVLGNSTGHWADAFQHKDHGVEPCASAGGHITLPMVVDTKEASVVDGV